MIATETAVRKLKSFVNGSWEERGGSPLHPITNPTTGDVIAQVPYATAEVARQCLEGHRLPDHPRLRRHFTVSTSLPSCRCGCSPSPSPAATVSFAPQFAENLLRRSSIPPAAFVRPSPLRHCLRHLRCSHPPRL
jgi:hypothetical protein